MPRTVLSLAVVACLLAACGEEPATGDHAEPAPVVATTEALTLPPDSAARADAAVEAVMAARDIREIPAHRHAFVDLDGDGADEVLVYLDDPNWCTDGACTLLVFQRGADGTDALIAEISPVRTPVSVPAQTHGGWRDILVTVGGDGVPTGVVALQHDGIGYPEDPTLLAALATEVVPKAIATIE